MVGFAFNCFHKALCLSKTKLKSLVNQFASSFPCAFLYVFEHIVKLIIYSGFSDNNSVIFRNQSIINSVMTCLMHYEKSETYKSSAQLTPSILLLCTCFLPSSVLLLKLTWQEAFPLSTLLVLGTSPTRRVGRGEILDRTKAFS